MIVRDDGTRLYAPSDLVAFLDGDFAAWMERLHAERRTGGSGGSGSSAPLFIPDVSDAETELVRRLGEEHEERVLATLAARHPGHVAIERGDDGALHKTLKAMRAGKPLIYQGRLDAGDWHGYPDFLLREEVPSELGAWSYRPMDAKLARSEKPYFLAQLCAYAHLLRQAQGVLPRTMGLWLGNSAEPTFETEQFIHYFGHLREVFERFQREFDGQAMPDPALERGYGRWESAALRLLEERDDLALTARITRGQVMRLRDAGITTMAQLAAAGPSVRRIGADVLARLRRQARLQVASRGQPVPAFEVLPHEPGRRLGLAALPPASSGDVFLDFEGFPLAVGGLEYLLGAVTLDDGAPTFRDWWAHDAAGEKASFEQLVDWLHARWRADPAMHVYHYASYEVTALRKLMGKHATREDEVDDLLRAEVFVDLYAMVRTGVAVGTRGYSLKDIEVLFAPKRAAGVTDAGSSVAEYQRWMDSGEPGDWQHSPILGAIRDYNREDCEHTWRLAEWLRERQADAGIAWMPPAESGAKDEEPREPEALAQALAARAEWERDGEAARITRLLMHLLQYHRRERKPMWWRFFDRQTKTDEELADDRDCLGGLERTTSPVEPDKRSFLVEYRFDADQDTKLEQGDKVYMVHAGGAPTKAVIKELDLDAGVALLRVGPGKPHPDRCNLIPDDDPRADQLVAAIRRFVGRWLEQGEAASPALADLLARRPPRVRAHGGGPLLGDAAPMPAGLIDLVGRLTGTTLCIQGPPGTGKTTNAAAAIAALARQGKRIGVTAGSHKVVLNLLGAVARAADASGGGVRIAKAGEPEGDPLIASGRIELCETNEVAGMLEEGLQVVGGTAWLFAREEMEDALDYLFVDEAGQVPLANALAVGMAAENLVFIGDQNQLAQPVQGTHPEESGASCLDYLLKDHATVPPERGVLLGTTWRLHPDLCAFVSAVSYENRLRPGGPAPTRRIVLGRDLRHLRRGTGIVMQDVAHEGNTHSSEEEADRIMMLVADLGQSVVEEGDARRPFDIMTDLLIVAPYNAQVRLLRRKLGGLRIGTVDKFQGQEAAVAIVSMCASSLEESPRGAAFLLNPNRLNVALSRAQCLAIVVASAGLIKARPSSVEEMRLLNLFCRIRSHAAGLGGPANNA